MRSWRSPFDAMRRFAYASDGAVALIFGLALIPLVFMAGGALDYSRASVARSALTRAADAAALAATREAIAELQSSNPNWSANAVRIGQNVFASNSVSIKGAVIGAPSISVSNAGNAVTSQLTFQAQFPTAFLKIGGLNSIAIGNSVASTSATPLNTDIHVVIDVSGSMGIGATLADQQAMLPAVGCTIACHYNDIWGETDTRAQARAAGATLRIDVVKQAVTNALNQAMSLPKAGRVRVAIWAFSNTLYNVFPLSTDINAAIAAVGSIDITGDVNQGGTNITYSLSQLSNSLSTVGSGLSLANPRGVIMLLTDSVQDSVQFIYSNGPGSLMTAQGDVNFVQFSPSQDFPVYTGDPILQTIDSQSCAPLKSKGYALFTLDVQYIVPTIQPDASEQRYAYLNETLTPLIPNAISACATASNYAYSANSPSDINAAVATMFANALGSNLRLSN